ncbi:hypothetical protein JDV02_004180 [Purpureocillium takamizusanense]|uniref:Uncharacterized protein n=1 Tax=Purpureocillium takamizusanense TaxID=2060973 RepID=A0A9Q8QFB8_9HYPO|nr:uncharacterized protein JDV02_004180 [Purpureocillium takamizusanense]UNI17866.1 hypothetical protein JDV02_004180 [Purpureocillium takamizusanense]
MPTESGSDSVRVCVGSDKDFDPVDGGSDPQPDPDPDPEPPEPMDIQAWVNDSGASVVLLSLVPRQDTQTQGAGPATHQEGGRS